MRTVWSRRYFATTCPSGRSVSADFGTYFIGYASTSSVIEKMLTNMFIGSPPGNHDRILDFSRAQTGCLFFVPSADHLDTPPTSTKTGSSSVDADDNGGSNSGGTVETTSGPATENGPTGFETPGYDATGAHRAAPVATADTDTDTAPHGLTPPTPNETEASASVPSKAPESMAPKG